MENIVYIYQLFTLKIINEPDSFVQYEFWNGIRTIVLLIMRTGLHLRRNPFHFIAPKLVFKASLDFIWTDVLLIDLTGTSIPSHSTQKMLVGAVWGTSRNRSDFKLPWPAFPPGCCFPWPGYCVAMLKDCTRMRMSSLEAEGKRGCKNSVLMLVNVWVV